MNLHRGFEGSYMGDNARLAPTARLECKICWHVYDPAQGCDTWDVPPGTPFAALPDHWRCPVCAAPVTPDDVFCGACGHKLKVK